jgi:hypothetical protein
MTRITAGRVPRHPEAFSHDLGIRRRRPRQESRDHLAFIRTLPCLICGSRKVEAAHIRARSPAYGKRGVGAGEKPDDKFTVPLCVDHHQQQHAVNEMTFWTLVGIDPFAIALSLFGCSGDEDAGEMVVKQARTLAHVKRSVSSR